MADTIISNTPGSREDSGIGWLIPLIVILAIVIGAFFMYQNGVFTANSDTDDTTNINVTVPDPTPAPASTE